MRGPKTLCLILCMAAALGMAQTADDDSDVRVVPNGADATVVPPQPGRDAGRTNGGPDVRPQEAPTLPKPAVSSSDRPAPKGNNEPSGPETDHLRGGRGRDGRNDGRHNRRGHYGRHDEWRHRNFHGSWHFLWHRGPIIFPVPVPVVRFPRARHRDPLKVYVRQTGGDYVGSEFASELRDYLRDQGLRPVYTPDDASLELYIVSMEQDPEDPGYSSAVSISYIWRPGHRFITAQMLDIGSGEIDDMAEMVAEYCRDITDDYR